MWEYEETLYLNGVFCLIIFLTFQKAGELLQAHKTLRELEMSRDELLYEQHKLENGSQGLGWNFQIKVLSRYINYV